MKRDEFIKTYLEGAALAPYGDLMYLLVGQLYDDRQVKQQMLEKIEFMDSVARETDWTMECRSCLQSFAPDCELSEMYGAERYCGRSERCCP